MKRIFLALAGFFAFAAVVYAQVATPYKLIPTERPDFSKMVALYSKPLIVNIPDQSDDSFFVSRGVLLGFYTGWGESRSAQYASVLAYTFFGEKTPAIFRWSVLKSGASPGSAGSYDYFIAFADGPIFHEAEEEENAVSVRVIHIELYRNTVEVTLAILGDDKKPATAKKLFVIRGLKKESETRQKFY